MKRIGTSRGEPSACTRIEQAFLPASLEIQATPPSPLGRGLLWALLSLLVVVLAWSCWARVDIVATASGKLLPGGRVKIVQAFERGVISAIHVRDGDRVERGDLLIEFDSTEAEAHLRQVETELADTRSRQLRLDLLKRYIVDEQATDHEGRVALRDEEQVLLAHEREQHVARIAQFEGERLRYDKELHTVESRIEGLRGIIALVDRRSGAVEQLAKVGHVSNEAWLRIAQEQVSLETELAALEGQRDTLMTTRSNLARSRAAYLAGRLRELTQAKVDTAREYARLRQEVAAARLRFRRHRLHAPEAGRIQELAIHTLGGVARPAQELLRIVPDEDELEIEANVLNRDSGEVRPGMPAVVKIRAYPFTRFGTLAATIVGLSADAVADEALGLVYKARVELASAMSANALGLSLEPGMAVTVEIRTGERRVIELLLNPLVKAIREAGRER